MNDKYARLGAIFGIVAVLFLMLWMGAAQADHNEPWDRTDKALGVLTYSLLAVDLMQTHEFLERPKIIKDDGNRYVKRTWKEQNPIIRELGRDGLVPYFVVVGAALYVVADYLDPAWRKALLATVSAVQLYTVYNNHENGVRININF